MIKKIESFLEATITESEIRKHGFVDPDSLDAKMALVRISLKSDHSFVAGQLRPCRPKRRFPLDPAKLPVGFQSKLLTGFDGESCKEILAVLDAYYEVIIRPLVEGDEFLLTHTAFAEGLPRDYVQCSHRPPHPGQRAGRFLPGEVSVFDR